MGQEHVVRRITQFGNFTKIADYKAEEDFFYYIRLMEKIRTVDRPHLVNKYKIIKIKSRRES